ncbi:glycerophosphodiester phosphodiesterase [Paenibacillus psychroresistens]|uniref:Glycerophosphodiester phosphodiesterase n=1 Tax=Paenibacillus psychroresistens TaxID=1778678 RepID=A0A6B8RDM9_9BACL|nr:glycerophosphodiester phosphodiesterase family protein [Paenibacillus psychroresistens]QGQ94541.1 glycerophosphodiester phosphodiesterase [Paenibacillus psychroresistens]
MLNIGHRGAAGEAPENTLASFLLAIKQGATAIELDVHVSADGEIVVCHDATIDRTTDSRGAIADLTVEQLKQADAGRWFNKAFTNERIPLLGEVFDAMPVDFPINVEIKSNKHPQVVQKLIALMQNKARTNSVIVSSFGYEVLYALKRAEPEIRIGLLYDKPIDYRALAEWNKVKLYSLHPHYKLVNHDYAKDVIAQGYMLYPWTIDNEVRMKELIENQVSGIITNFPGRLNQLLVASDQ